VVFKKKKKKNICWMLFADGILIYLLKKNHTLGKVNKTFKKILPKLSIGKPFWDRGPHFVFLSEGFY